MNSQAVQWFLVTKPWTRLRIVQHVLAAGMIVNFFGSALYFFWWDLHYEAIAMFILATLYTADVIDSNQMSTYVGINEESLQVWNCFHISKKPWKDVKEFWRESTNIFMRYGRFGVKTVLAPLADGEGFLEAVARLPGFQRDGLRVFNERYEAATAAV
jgi:hypothetical protein